MKRFTTAFFVLLLLATPVLAQNRTQSAVPQQNGIVHAVTTEHHVSPQLGRDLWFTMIQNYGSSTGDKYYNLYVTSSSSTNIHVQPNGGAEKVLVVQAGTVATFKIPLAWEMTTSSIVEKKAIHVWSNDADVSAYLLSHNDYTSDGMFIIPTIGWGRDYVVAAYNALFEGGGSYVYDEPSEMAIVANQDNTVCTIIPSCDMRVESTPHSCAACLAHAKGVPFNDTLNKGECIQYESLRATDTESYDMTGTVVHANRPVGVVGGSQCPNIPMSYPYCDHVCEMMPPVRAWSSQYYTTPFYPAGLGKQYSTYLVISSKANQIIHRYDPVSGDQQYCVLGAQYDHNFRADINTASRWTSDAPFLLVQYINSATFPDGVNGSGDPAEVVINGVGQFTKTVVFQTPGSVGNQSPYINYANLVVSNAAISSTTFDGKNVNSFTKFSIDDQYTVFRVNNIKAGMHTAKSDSGVGVYVYGYGFDESYAWTGAYGTGTFDAPDLAPPAPTVTNGVMSAHITLTKDGGADGSNAQLSYLRLDAANNMTYTIDPTWLEGAGTNSSYYDEQVLDSTKPGLLQVSAFDDAGNMSQIVSKYDPQRATITGSYVNFGTGNFGSNTTIVRYDTLTNTGGTAYPVTDLRLALGSAATGFSIDSADMSTLAIGEKRLIKISFLPKQAALIVDTIIFGDGFLDQQAIVTGGAGTAASVDNASGTQTPARLTISDDGRTAHAILPTTWTKTFTIAINDVRGVNVLTTSAEPNGVLDFDLSSLSSGVYFYHLSCGNESAAGKLAIRK